MVRHVREFSRYRTYRIDIVNNDGCLYKREYRATFNKIELDSWRCVFKAAYPEYNIIITRED